MSLTSTVNSIPNLTPSRAWDLYIGEQGAPEFVELSEEGSMTVPLALRAYIHEGPTFDVETAEERHHIEGLLMDYINACCGTDYDVMPPPCTYCSEPYLAAYWHSDDGQREVVLTTREDAGASRDALRAMAREEAARTGLSLESGRLVVGYWTD